MGRLYARPLHSKEAGAPHKRITVSIYNSARLQLEFNVNIFRGKSVGFHIRNAPPPLSQKYVLRQTEFYNARNFKPKPAVSADANTDALYILCLCVRNRNRLVCHASLWSCVRGNIKATARTLQGHWLEWASQARANL